MEHSLSNTRSKNSLSNTLQKSKHDPLRKENFDNHELEMNFNMNDFGDPNLDMNMGMDVGLEEIQRAENLVSENFEKVRGEGQQALDLPRELGFDQNVLSEDANIFNQSFNFTRDFSNQLQNARRSLSRSKRKINPRKRPINDTNRRGRGRRKPKTLKINRTRGQSKKNPLKNGQTTRAPRHMQRNAPAHIIRPKAKAHIHLGHKKARTRHPDPSRR